MIKQYTTADIKFLIKNWETMTGDDIAKEIGVNPATIYQLAKLIREAGYALPKKGSNLKTTTVISEALKELGLEENK